MLRPGVGSAGTRASDGGDTGGCRSPGGTPVAVAEFVTWPASMSSCVSTYVAVQMSWAPGAIDAVPAGQSIADSGPVPEKSPSVIATSVSVTLPVLVTTKE